MLSGIPVNLCCKSMHFYVSKCLMFYYYTTTFVNINKKCITINTASDQPHQNQQKTFI